jgi:hypothetical protein
MNQRLTQIGNTMQYTDTQHKSFYGLPREIIIGHILPFVGGVRAPQSRINQLQKQFKNFMIASDNFIAAHYRNGSINNGSYIRNFVGCSDAYDNSWREKWGTIISRIDNKILHTSNNEHKTHQRYKAEELTFTAQEWLGFWVEIEEILLSDFKEVDLSTWLFYAEIYRPTTLINY